MTEETQAKAEWWKTAVIYQVYPRSFQDSNGDGVGDLDGIAGAFPILQGSASMPSGCRPSSPRRWPISAMTSPITTRIDPLFGTLADFDSLIAEAHALGLKVILDFVPNHTSEQHPWFIESRSGLAEPETRLVHLERSQGPEVGRPTIGSSFRRQRLGLGRGHGQYYYHAYLKEQPDLNWRNPEVRAAMHDVLRFWLELGVDGFRVDVIWHLIKDADSGTTRRT